MQFSCSSSGARLHLSAVRRSRLRFCAAVLIILLIRTTAEAEWRFAWRTDPSTGEYACSATSDARRVRTRAGGSESDVRLGVQGEGLMTIQSDPAPFDAKRQYETWIRVDDNRMAVHLSRSDDGRTLTFSEEDSIALHRQFETGSTIFVALVFVSGDQPVVEQFSLDGYRTVTAQYKGCRGLMLNPGWLGLSMTAASKNHPLFSWIRSNTPYQTPGIEIVTVDPRKEAYKSDLRPGDLIVGYNGHAGEIKDLISAMKNLETGGSIELSVVRGRSFLKKIVTRPASPDREDRD